MDVQLPSAPPRAPRLPLLPPKPLKVVMADVRLPVPLTELWAAVFANPADLLPAFHKARGDFEFSMSPWRQAGECLRGGGVLCAGRLQRVGCLPFHFRAAAPLARGRS